MPNRANRQACPHRREVQSVHMSATATSVCAGTAARACHIVPRMCCILFGVEASYVLAAKQRSPLLCSLVSTHANKPGRATTRRLKNGCMCAKTDPAVPTTVMQHIVSGSAMHTRVLTNRHSTERQRGLTCLVRVRLRYRDRPRQWCTRRGRYHSRPEQSCPV